MILKASGTVPEENEKLYGISRGFEITNFKILRRGKGRLKRPHAFSDLRLEIISNHDNIHEK